MYTAVLYINHKSLIANAETPESALQIANVPLTYMPATGLVFREGKPVGAVYPNTNTILDNEIEDLSDTQLHDLSAIVEKEKGERAAKRFFGNKIPW